MYWPTDREFSARVVVLSMLKSDLGDPEDDDVAGFGPSAVRDSDTVG